MSNIVNSLGNTVVQVHATYSGSAQGATDLYKQNLIQVTYPDGNHSGTNGVTEPNLAPDISMSDNWPVAMANPIQNNLFDDTAGDIVGVNVFGYVVPNNLYSAGLTNITRETAQLLITASGSANNPGMPANYIGGTSTNLIYLFGRDIGSGTRITTFATVGFAGTPTQYALDSNGNLVLAKTIAGQTFAISGNGISVGSSTFVKTNTSLGNPPTYALDGYDSGGVLVTCVDQTTNGIGYAGYPDATSSGNGTHHHLLSFQGVSCTPSNVESGAYPFWSYEHCLSVGITGNKATIKAALIAKLTDPTFQNTDSGYAGVAARLNYMEVQRFVDGGKITTTSNTNYPAFGGF
jgi:ABC-type phosphate transport system substrate-binding protein